MIRIGILLLAIFYSQEKANEPVRQMEYEGKVYRTAYNVSRFNGKYSGAKDGYLEIREDGTGTYVYDIFGLALNGCKKGPIEVEYGFLINENDSLVRISRDYGYSYPIILRATGETSFQGCRTPVMLDFLMEYQDGTIGVSSSDDWIKLED
ncbi:hypothetical protein [Fulvivirga sedimenti]|uniref:Uncharacterized protein n=1 Tax=Fulvivirga sedimenti TaxID=2879465 RepID=A0A9X1HNF2_9BACT|nr:hypothetical protein [Fulvivirga sedimenti]MCA6075414.1 hypothetical protein [Fulvivirga sedimenti]MCA6076591.1 hypothetical protein [Fulvivirga sedimenti]MCA6077719.1 hypothetical protein [Fulvivirga sedimenti]